MKQLYEKIKADPTYASFDYMHHSYLLRGLYVDQLEDWTAHFSREQMLVLKTEALYEDGEATLRRAFEFLELPYHAPEKFKKLNSVGATHISNWMMFGGMEHEKLMRSIRLMGEEVIPALKDLDPPASLYEELAEDAPITAEELQSPGLSRAPRDMAT